MMRLSFQRQQLQRLDVLLVPLVLLPGLGWSQPLECFQPGDGYRYSGSGTPLIETSVLGKAIRDYLDIDKQNASLAQAVQAKYGPTINDWCVGAVESMDFIFYYLSSFNEDISRWNVSSATTMQGMFFAAPSFNQNIGNWNVSSVTNMHRMFRVARSFNQDIGDWDVSRVTDMSEMFFDTDAFNQSSIANWNVSSVTDMSGMFEDAQSFQQNLCPWHQLLNSSTIVNDIFLGSACLEPSDPMIDHTNDNDGPFCVASCSTMPLPSEATSVRGASLFLIITLMVGWIWQMRWCS